MFSARLPSTLAALVMLVIAAALPNAVQAQAKPGDPKAPATATPKKPKPDGKSAKGKDKDKAKPAEPGKGDGKPPAPVVVPDPPIYRTPTAVLDRVKMLLPDSYAKLSKRQPVHILVIGDEVAGMAGHGDADGNELLAWPAHFAAELAREFFYGGGVRIIKPNKNKPAKAVDTVGPEITVSVRTLPGGTIQKAIPMLNTYYSNIAPDIIVIGFSAHDVQTSGDLMIYARTLQELADAMEGRPVDLVFASPMVMAGEPLMNTLGASRALAGIARDLAAEHHIAFADIGDIAGFVSFDADAFPKPEDTLNAVAAQYRRFFVWPQGMDYRRPNPALHERMGERALESILDTAKPTAWKLKGGTATLLDGGICEASFTIENPAKTALKVNLVPLKLPRWIPQNSPMSLDLHPGEVRTLKLPYVRVASGDSLQFPAFAAHEPELRLPLLVVGGTTARVEEARCHLKPLAVLWKLESLYNQEKTFTLENMVLNTAGQDLKAVPWTAEWNGQKREGKLDIAPDGDASLPITFDLPAQGGDRRIASPLILKLTVNGHVMQWERAVEISRNFGLALPVNMHGGARLTPTADKDWLTLTFDLGSAELRTGPGGAGLQALINLDGRMYGKRLKPGTTEPLLITTGTADGGGYVAPIAPWSFGTGYAMKFDSGGVRVNLTTEAGNRRLTVNVPRTYLYQHEWAIGNGNSQLGINARITLWQTGGEKVFYLNNNGRDTDDAEGLAALELTDKPTTRWSVIVW